MASSRLFSTIADLFLTWLLPSSATICFNLQKAKLNFMFGNSKKQDYFQPAKWPIEAWHFFSACKMTYKPNFIHWKWLFVVDSEYYELLSCNSASRLFLIVFLLITAQWAIHNQYRLLIQFKHLNFRCFIRFLLCVYWCFHLCDFLCRVVILQCPIYGIVVRHPYEVNTLFCTICF